MRDSTETIEIDLRALGPPEIQGADGPVALPPKLLAVYVYLVVAPPGEAVRRDTLLALLWPELDQARARNALNQALHQLRRQLGEAAVESRGKEELAAGTPVTADVPRFEERLDGDELEPALDLYRGEFLEGFHVSGVPGFERWLDGVRARLRRRARDAAVELARHAAEAGRQEEAARWLRRALEVVPTDERVATSLVELLLRQGDRAGAVRAYRTFARRLEEELEMEPSAGLRQRVAEARAGRAPPDGPELRIISVPPPERRLAAGLVDRARGMMEGDRPENAAARELLRQAVDLDTTYGPAWAAGARATARWVRELGGPHAEAAAAVAAGRRAVELDPAAAGPRVALGLALEAAARPEDAVDAARAGLRADPRDVEAAALLSRVQLWAGQYGASARTSREAARRLGDHHLPIVAALASAVYSLSAHDEGEELYGRLLEESSSLIEKAGLHYFDIWFGREDRAARRARAFLEEEPDQFVWHFYTAETALAADDTDAAIRHYDRCFRMDPDSRDPIGRSTRAMLGFVHLKGGDAARGRALLEAAEAADRLALEAGATWGTIPHDLALVHAARGEREEALHWLERAHRAGWRPYFELRAEPVFADLRGEERFRDVADAMERDVDEQRTRVMKGR